MPLDSMNGGGGRSRNVLGGVLRSCSENPVTGFFRNGCCATGPQDRGSHTVCAVMTEAFLALSQRLGNDLSTPMPAYGFPGLKPGDQWCLCAPRWQEALLAGCAPLVILQATEASALAYCALGDLIAHAAESG